MTLQEFRKRYSVGMVVNMKFKQIVFSLRQQTEYMVAQDQIDRCKGRLRSEEVEYWAIHKCVEGLVHRTAEMKAAFDQVRLSDHGGSSSDGH
jgi:hypothetical protein